MPSPRLHLLCSTTFSTPKSRNPLSQISKQTDRRSVSIPQAEEMKFLARVFNHWSSRGSEQDKPQRLASPMSHPDSFCHDELDRVLSELRSCIQSYRIGSSSARQASAAIVTLEGQRLNVVLTSQGYSVTCLSIATHLRRLLNDHTRSKLKAPMGQIVLHVPKYSRLSKTCYGIAALRSRQNSMRSSSLPFKISLDSILAEVRSDHISFDQDVLIAWETERNAPVEMFREL